VLTELLRVALGTGRNGGKKALRIVFYCIGLQTVCSCGILVTKYQLPQKVCEGEVFFWEGAEVVGKRE
jgi:hypothetical protein